MAMGRRFWPTAALAFALVWRRRWRRRRKPQDFPVRPVHVIVPFAPGGGVDIVARLIAPKLSEAWGQPVVIENKPGAVGAVASEYVMHQPADGYTVLIGVAGSHAIAQYLNPNLGYDPVRDFAGVTVLSYSPLICLVAPSSPFHTMKELVDIRQDDNRAVRQPRRRFADASDRRNVQSQLRHEIPARRLSRRGAGDAGSARRPYSDGDGRNGLGEAARHLGPVAGAGGDRHEAKCRACPTCRHSREAGYPNFEVNSWFALFVPVAHAEADRRQDRRRCDQDRPLRPRSAARLADDGWEPGGGTPAEFTTMWLQTSKQLGAVIQERHITVE